MRKFKTGAVRDNDEDKLQFTRCFSPIVLIRVAEFLRRNNQTADGKRREDNWKKGFSREAYLESKGRHFIETWLIEEGLKEYPDLKNTEDIADIEIEELLESLCAEFFNTHGFIHFLLLEQRKRQAKKKLVKTENRLENLKETCDFITKLTSEELEEGIKKLAEKSQETKS